MSILELTQELARQAKELGQDIEELHKPPFYGMLQEKTFEDIWSLQQETQAD